MRDCVASHPGVRNSSLTSPDSWAWKPCSAFWPRPSDHSWLRPRAPPAIPPCFRRRRSARPARGAWYASRTPTRRGSRPSSTAVPSPRPCASSSSTTAPTSRGRSLRASGPRSRGSPRRASTSSFQSRCTRRGSSNEATTRPRSSPGCWPAPSARQVRRAPSRGSWPRGARRSSRARTEASTSRGRSRCQSARASRGEPSCWSTTSRLPAPPWRACRVALAAAGARSTRSLVVARARDDSEVADDGAGDRVAYGERPIRRPAAL